VALDNDSRGTVQVLTHKLRMSGISAECDTSGRGFKSQMKSAGACKFACIIGADERANETVAVKDLSDGSQVNIPMSEAVKYLEGNL
ncbi:MAG: hypothetical protein IJF90_03855, partial [Synergistaceae bacterium]|nr:hypothetical protein [Synergistaceae bacterium]